MGGIDFLRDARAELLEGNGEDRGRLRAAARLFRRAVLVGRPTWPRGRRGQADALRDMLGTGGDIDQAVEGMDEAAMRAASDALWRFCDAAWAGDFLPAETADTVGNRAASARSAVVTYVTEESASENARPRLGGVGPRVASSVLR